MVIGQKTNHGLAMSDKTKTDDQPRGVSCKAIETMEQKNKSEDTSAEIEMEAELQKVEFQLAINYYNDIVAVTSRYEVKKTDTDLIKIMLTKVTSVMFAAMILDHMENPNESDDLEELCNEIG